MYKEIKNMLSFRMQTPIGHDLRMNFYRKGSGFKVQRGTY